MMMLEEGRRRVVIEGVLPQIDGGRYAIKRTVGEQVVVEADAFVDGHDAISCALLYRPSNTTNWHEVPMESVAHEHWRGAKATDRWRASFVVNQIGSYVYTILAWVDHFKSWRRDFQKRVNAQQDVSVDLLVGGQLVEAASKRAAEQDAEEDALWLRSWANTLQRQEEPIDHRVEVALDNQLAQFMARYPNRSYATTYERELPVVAERERARFSAWYEMFPRSCSREPGRHGTFRECIERLPYIANMGFDVIYLPPIHPIGVAFRKGKNNALTAEINDVGSPWAIGAPSGGHKAIHPELGTLDDFHLLVSRAREFGIEIALDVAFQCSPDHPYVKKHPEWFKKRPDGTIQYAENPPKKYQDIYPFDFETEDWQGMWEELKSIFLYWINQGVHIFRVDNPHTKSFPFWEWAITEIKREHPGTIFLAEAFTRPKVMYNLAKLGFTQSYTYFAWRNTKYDLIAYMEELTQTEVVEYFRPNFWPNTPDILNEYLQTGGRPSFIIRLVLAATMTASYGIYGPTFELCVNTPREFGSEEYLDSEKYEIRHWDLENPISLRHIIAQVNHIRRTNPSLQSNASIHFHPTDNDQIICYSKQTSDAANIVLVVVNLDPYHTQSGWLEIDLDIWDLDTGRPYQVHDLLTDSRYLWHGSRNYVELNPHTLPAHIFQVRRHARTEQDFDYYM
jgi:starch synthase (maltosyl-transferring)